MKARLYVITALFAVLPATSVVASYHQKMEVCITVNNNHTGESFYASFFSTDIFERGNFTKDKKNGTSCKSHTYKHGPKHMQVLLTSDDYSGAIYLDSSCVGYHITGMQVDSGIHRITSHHEQWSFNLKRYRNGFKVYCSKKG